MPPSEDPEGEPQYRVYRSRKPLFPKRGGGDRDALGDPLAAARPPAGDPSRPAPDPIERRRRRRPRAISPGRVAWLLFLFVAGWTALSAVVFLVSAQIQQGKVSDANQFLGGAGYPAWSANNVLVLGSDVRDSANAEPGAQTTGNGRSDSIMLMRIGGGANSRLSIARDTVVDIPGAGRQRINAAYAIGGAALAVQTIERYTGIDINHVMIVELRGLPAADRRDGRHHVQGRLRRVANQRRLRPGRLHPAPARRQDPHRRQAGARAGADAQEQLREERERPHPGPPPAEDRRRHEAPAAVADGLRAPAADLVERAQGTALGHERTHADRAVRRAVDRRLAEDRDPRHDLGRA